MRRIAPQQYCIAAQQMQAVFSGMSVLRKHVGFAQIGAPATAAAPPDKPRAWRKTNSPSAKKRRPPLGGLESREETPKEGMRGNRRTGTNLAQSGAIARTQSSHATTC